ncbi:hypothetical protein ROZALSC1DRAFT_30781 [Rozella allomycis CSF55]|uniref:RanBP2-type domain-containing protein n=1 Tax=Rozella allomycis (strain CSF55) TaxID=988480 RepID=A0A4P9YDC3_ROZAC|nr:hypothetical protein ROZALSC1DRAFT_30781 [Rozella allomycis CSF55]
MNSPFSVKNSFEKGYGNFGNSKESLSRSAQRRVQKVEKRASKNLSARIKIKNPISFNFFKEESKSWTLDGQNKESVNKDSQDWTCKHCLVSNPVNVKVCLCCDSSSLPKDLKICVCGNINRVTEPFCLKCQRKNEFFDESMLIKTTKADTVQTDNAKIVNVSTEKQVIGSEKPIIASEKPGFQNFNDKNKTNLPKKDNIMVMQPLSTNNFQSKNTDLPVIEKTSPQISNFFKANHVPERQNNTIYLNEAKTTSMVAAPCIDLEKADSESVVSLSIHSDVENYIDCQESIVKENIDIVTTKDDMEYKAMPEFTFTASKESLDNGINFLIEKYGDVSPILINFQ